jgi:hypothetical protein
MTAVILYRVRRACQLKGFGSMNTSHAARRAIQPRPQAHRNSDDALPARKADMDLLVSQGHGQSETRAA